MPSCYFRAALCGSILLCGFSVFSQSPSTTPESPRHGSGTDTRNTPDAANGKAYAPSCSYTPNPPYTKEARDAKFQGVVRVEAIVMPDGSVTNIRIMKSPGMGLDESILETLKTWKCTPATYNGKLVPTKIPIELNFRLKPETH